MSNGYSTSDLVDFLNHAAEKGLMPAATAQALAVASRNMFGMLDPAEQEDVRQIDLDSLVRRFSNKRATEFSPGSLREYGSRVRRAVEHFVRWRDDPARFSVKTRATRAAQNREGKAPSTRTRGSYSAEPKMSPTVPATRAGAYDTSVLLRPGWVVTIANLPEDLSPAEADRLATWIKMSAVVP